MTYDERTDDAPPQEWPLYATSEFRVWFESLEADTQVKIDYVIQLLADNGPMLGHPYVHTLTSYSKHVNLKELRIHHRGDAFRVLFAFDPRRAVILLLGGRKPNNKWYKSAVQHADKLYDEYLTELKRRGEIE